MDTIRFPIVLAAALLIWTATAQTGESGYRVVGASITGASEVKQAAGAAQSRLELDSSDARLVEGFHRAKRQAMAYVFEGDPVGPWYEAAEPGREAFCMRDVAHQAMGAQALGLARHNLNMLRRFAENISDSRDWCSLWEIDRFNRPAPVDYQSDALFWYNLPANFDILDACHRMYLWSGDQTYVRDPVFLNFYDRTVSDYVERWGLGLEQAMTRPRLLNIRGIPGNRKFQSARGIPGYDEGNHEYTLGGDVLATQYAAYMAYAHIQEVRGNADLARSYLKKAADVRSLVNTTWWNEKEQSFYLRVGKGHNLEGRGGGNLVYWGVVDDGPKLKSAMANPHYLESYYRYGDPDAARERLLDAMTPGRSRMEYPEVPYSIISTVANGTMGINLETASALLSSVEGYWVEAAVKTLSGLGANIAWAELRNLPIRANEVTVRHEGTRKTTFTNLHGPALIWHAAFPGSHDNLLVNGKAMKAQTEKGPLGRTDSWVRVTVGAGGSVTVTVPE
ncbi:MAG TPA: hypothetical protein VMJ75_30675 [Candidatus Acidoferrales bacterium]|nr:hypothetical protein [Candidatus Acidoferrales bacterium]